jgi:hypothetical protein
MRYSGAWGPGDVGKEASLGLQAQSGNFFMQEFEALLGFFE